tara:strand:+ start:13198 stop:14028 length:831 start_codon:yes stop_codon:yes gene_type:complete
MANFPVIYGTRLTVGSEVSAGISKIQTKPFDFSLLGGLSILNGPVQVGVAPLSPVPLGSIHVGPTPPTSGPPALAGAHIAHPVVGVNILAPIAANLTGVVNVLGARNTTGAVNEQSVSVKNGSDIKNGINIGNVNTVFNGNVRVNGTFTCEAVKVTGIINVQPWKKFEIDHPTKKGWKLSHVCPEAPDPEVYIRGTTTSNRIELPDYWKGLVDLDTVSVHLTPIGQWQSLYFEKIEWNKTVIIKNADSGPINCSYQIWAKTTDWQLHKTEFKEGEE